MIENKVSVISAFLYTGISLALALAFYLITGGGGYDAVARYGGAIWVFILTMIITMPVVIPWIKKRYE
ncbi:hypothetical protein FDZ74_07380 [bacterium]|nr:MAG: hypothetical protein FDZ74_07380 [bacterium]